MSGHVKGNLNIIAIRKGWSRNFTLEAEAVETMDYSTLEHLLELDTLKLRAARLRMFVEQPAGSGTFLSVRSWKDDGSLQTSLMRGFFVERAQSQVPMVFDIRDEDLTPALPGRASEKAREWIKTHTLPRGSASNTPSNELGAPEAEESTTQEQSASAANGGFFGMFKGSPAATPSKDSPPTPPPSDPDVDAEKEEDVLLQRGWKRVLRPLTRKKTKKESTTASDADIQADGDGEQVEMPDPKDVSAAALLVSDKQNKASGMSFITRRKSKKDVKGKGKDADAPPVPSKQES